MYYYPFFFTGKFDNSDHDAVVLLEKTPFSETTLPQMLSRETSLAREFNNDIYSQYLCHSPPSLNTLKSTVIYPATAKHLEKYSAQDVHFIYETPSDYQTITLPFIEEQSFSIQVRLEATSLWIMCGLLVQYKMY